MCVPWLYSVDPLPLGSHNGSLDQRKAVFGLLKALSVLTEEPKTCRLRANTVATQWGHKGEKGKNCSIG